jgi:CIC family chloride channel protein
LLRNLKYLFLKSFDVRTQILIRVALVGVLVGIIAVLFRKYTEDLSHLFFHHLYIKDTWWDWVYPVLICTGGGLLAGWLTNKFAPDAKGSGIPQVKHALNNSEVQVSSLKTILVKFLGAMIGIASGLSMGREGPTIQIGAGIGHKTAQILDAKHHRRALASGAGAGLASAFNTPIAGVMFVIEELDNKFSSTSLGPAIVGSVCAAITCRLLYGDFFTFHFRSDTETDLITIPLYIILGVVCGILGVMFQKSIIHSLDLYKHKISKFLPAWSHGALAGFITGLVMLWLPQATGGGHATLEGIFVGMYAWYTILLIFVFKYLLTILAYGSGVPGGIFAPALILGALAGASFGHGINFMFPQLEVEPALFAYVGMGAFFTGISRAPITSIIMLFELTGNYDMVLPLMFGCIIANITAERTLEGSIYENLLEREGIRLEENETSSSSYLKRYKIVEVMTTNPEWIYSNITLGTMNRIFKDSEHSGFPVLNPANDNLVGIVTHNDLRKAFSSGKRRINTVAEIMSTSPIVASTGDNLHTAILQLYEHKIGRLLIVETSKPHKLKGIITRSDIINFEANKEID